MFRKFAVLAAAVGLFALSVFAATKTVTWSLPADWESSADFGYPSDPVGAPALKFIPVSIAVPEGSVYSNCTVEATWVATDDPRPEVINEPHIVGEAPILSPEDPQYWNAAYFPATPESIGGIQTCAGEAAIMAWVTPYRWNGRTQKLEKATALKLTFTYDAPRAKLKLKTSSANGYTGVLYIISPSQFAGMWGGYIAYRQETHPQIEFKVVNATTEIYSVSPYSGGRDDAQRIHKYLEARWAEAKAAGQKMYVILGGGCKKDSESYDNTKMIPLPMTATRNRYYYPSDLYYACMDNPAGKGEVWDPNNDGILLGYKSGGGYVSDARGQVDVMPDIAVSRFPVRPTASLDGKSKSAQEQINGLVAKLRRAEAADFSGNHNSGLAGLKIFAEKSHGNTENWMTQERTFYDGMVNMWSASHDNVVQDFEYNLRNQHVNWWFQNRPLKNFYGSTSSNPNAVPNNNMELYVNEAHGAPSGAGPLSNSQMWKATAIQKVALWDMPCSTGKIDDDRLTLPEAMLLNPDGGALVSYNNSREGYGSANNFDTLSALMERENRRAYLANDLNNRASGDAFIEAHRTFLSSVGNLQLSATAMACYIETLAFGDPLVKLSQVQDGNVNANPSGLFLRTGTTTATDINVGSQSSVVTLKTPDLGGGALTIRGQSFKAYKGATINNGDLVWDAPGGVGGSGVKFTTRRGNLTVSATGTTYFGPNFTGVNNLLVSGYNCTLDFDKTGSTRDVTQLGFIGAGSGSSAGTNYLRCREGGIFSPTMTIPVVNGTLALQTQNVGGGGAASNPNVPIFVLTNATLRVDTNPNWGAEFFNRAIWLNNSCIAANYQSVGFGANVDARPGLDIWVFGSLGSVIAGPQDFEVVGELRVHCENGARITSTASLNKSSRSGSISKLGTGTLTLSAKNTVSGGIRVKEGRVIADNVAGLGTGEVIVESNAVLQLKSLPLTSLTRLTIKKGGKLILPGAAETASYKIVDPLTSSLNFETGALVYNEHDENTPLTGNTSTDGCYLDTSLFLNWKGGNGNWSTATTDTNWKTKTVESKAFAQGDAVQFPDYGKTTNTIAVSGALVPGQMNFSNPDTAYRFTGTGASISLGTLYTGGNVSFEPSLAVDGNFGVTAGRTEVRNVGATSVSVGPDATFKVNGEVASYVYINKIELNISKFKVNKFTWPAFLGGGTVVDCKGWRVGEIQFYRGSSAVTLPVGTTITVYAPNGVTSGKLTYKTWTSTVTSSANGKITGVSGDSDPKNLFDQSTTTYMGIALNTGSDGEHNYAPTCKVTITPSAPIKMFDSFKIGSADAAARNPDSWTLSVTENSTGSAKTVLTRSGQSGGSCSSLWSYSLDSTPSASGSTAVSVAAGGALENGGTYKAKVNFADGAKIKVGGSGTINVAGGVTFGGNTTIDVSEAQKISGWREILTGANLAVADVYKFPLSSDDAVAKVENGKLYVATENIVKGPYSRQVSGDCNWNTTDWKNDGAAFPATWASVITRPTGITYLDVTGPTTMTLDAPVSVGTIYVTNTTGNAASLNLVKSGDNTVLATLLDFSGFNGPVAWAPNINGASVNVGSNAVTLAEGAGATLTVASNGFATVVGPFAGYNVDKFARVHFSKTNRGLTMSQIPAAGTVSFDGMELQDGGGGFQKADLTYRIENGQSLTLKETGSMNARTQSSFEIYGGTLTVKPNGAWWFGQNGVTSYTQTNGTVTVEATGTTVGNSGSGVVFGYTGEASFVFEMNISGGLFEVPNSILNIWNPTTISLSSNAVLRAKGAGARSGVAGTIEVGEGTIFEVGSAGLAAGSMKYNLYGGTLAAFEDTNINAPITLGGAGTLAAKADTLLSVTGAIKADGASLNFGKAGYAGAVRLAALPAGVTNVTVTAGTWDLGSIRPTDLILSKLDGKIAAELTDAELREAAEGGFKLIKTTLPEGALSEGHVAVVTRDGTAVTAMGRVEDGDIYLSVDYVYPLYATTVVPPGAQLNWANLDWHDSIGMPFHGEWSEVDEAVLSNDLAGVTLVVTNAFTSELAVINTGNLTLTRAAEGVSPYLDTLNDSQSTGKTTVDLTANNITVGAETVIKKAGSGTLTLAAGKCAALWNNLTWSGTMTGFSGTAKIKYVGDDTLTSAPYNASGAGYVSYAQTMAMENLAFENSLTRFFEEGADVTVTRFVTGNQKNASGQVFHQTGGRIAVTGTGSVADATATSTSPILFSHWPNNVTYHLTGGELIATNGVDGSIYFGRDGVPKLYIGGGEGRAVMRVNGFVNDGRSGGSKSGSLVELKPNGYLEIGKFGFLLNQSAELRMSGGTFLAYDNAEIKSATSAFTLTANTTSHLAAAAGKTLTVSKIPTGTGALICGDATNNGTVMLSGDYSNVTLGGTFTLKMTAAQSASVVDVPLFKVADAESLHVTVQKNDGTVSEGAYRVVDGMFRWMASGNYALPLKATITEGALWKGLDWYDSSVTPQKVPDTFWSTSTSATVCELTVESDAVITKGDAITAGTVTITGNGALTLPDNLTVNTLKGDGKVVADAYMPTWGGLTANTWTGTVKLTGTFPANKNIGALGNVHSMIEFAGNMPEPNNGYFATPVEVNSPFVLSGTMKISNGNSNTIQVKFNQKFSGTGMFTTYNNSKPGTADIFQVLGDASEFAGAITLDGAAHSITFGAHASGTGGYIYITDDNGATIAADKQWAASSGCAINVDAGGVLNIEYRTGNAAATSNVSVQSGGYINLLQTAASQTVWPITSGTLTMNGGVKVNGVIVGKDWYSVANGKITLNANAVGASVSINVIGGNKGKAGKSIGDNTYAGAVPVQGKNWNQGAAKSDNTAVNVPMTGLKEVLVDGTVINGPMKATLVGACAYSADGKSTNPNGDGELMFGYLDDGQTSGSYGATITVENIPYSSYAVYIYMGTDVSGKTSNSFGPITVISEGKTIVYPEGATTAWGSADATHGTVTLVNGGTSGNYLMFSGFSGSTLTVKGYKNGTVSGARCGIAGIQIFNTGTRVNTLTWNGGATGGTWDRTTANWKNSANAVVAWTEVADGINTAAFNGNTTLTLGEVVSPDVLDIRSNAVTSAETGFITTGDMLVAENMQIADVTAISGEMWGAYVSNDGPATPCFFTKAADNQSATVQMQLKDGELKCVKLTLTQDGSNIKARADYAKYVANTYAVGSVNFDTSTSPKPSDSKVVTTDDGQGYGIKKLKLYNHSIGNLTVANAERFGKAFTVAKGVLTVAAGALTQDVTLASGGKLDIITTEITNEYVVTSGKIVNGGYDNILVNGEAIDQDSWNLAELTSGKLKRITKPGTTPFTYTIAESGTTQWTNAPWVASNFFYVLPEEWTTGTVSEVKLTVEGGVTNTLVANANMTITKMNVLNSGYLTMANGLVGGDTLGAPFSLTVATLDDSASSGKTTLNFAPNSVKAGANTILSKSIAGKLTVAGGSKATINGTAGSYEVAANGEVRFVGDKVTSVVAATETEGATVSYRNADFTFSDTKYWTLKLYEGDYVYANVNEFINPIVVAGGELVLTNKTSQQKIWYGGENVTGKPHSSIAITGGRMTVLCSGVETAAATCGFLFGQTAKGDTTPSLTINGGDFDISGGRFTFWEKGDVTVANGVLSAKGINKHNSDALSSLAINGGGVVALGSLGLATEKATSLSVTMNGGTLRAVDNASDSVAIALAATNTFSAAANKTLIVSGLLSGAGSVVIGEEGYAGTVKLTITNSFTGGVSLAQGTFEVPNGSLKGDVEIGDDAILNVIGTAGQTEYAITDGTVSGDIDNIRLNGKALPKEEKWEIGGGKIKRRIITPPFAFTVAENANWSAQKWHDAAGLALRDGELEEYPSAPLEVTLSSMATLTFDTNLTSRTIGLLGDGTLLVTNTTHFAESTWTLSNNITLELAMDGTYVYDAEKLVQSTGLIRVTSGTFRLPKKVTLTGNLTIESGAILDIATDDETAAEYDVTKGILTVTGKIYLNGKYFPNVRIEGGKVIRTELKDFHVTLPEGTTTTNFSAIVWDEGAYSNGTNHTVTINAPAGCEIVIDESITNQSFTVNGTGTCSVKVVNEAIVALSDGFLGNIASIAYGENTMASTFSLNGSTGWTCAKSVSFDLAIIDPNGCNIAYTGEILPAAGYDASYVSVADHSAGKNGCVTFHANASGLGSLSISSGAVKFEATTPVNIGSVWGAADGRMIIAANESAPAIEVDSDVTLNGTTLDIDTFTEEPIPEEAVEYKLIRAPYIDAETAKLGTSFKGNWELKVVPDGEFQTLVARKTKKGFYFLITDVEIGEETHTVAYHDAKSKDALDIDRDWVAEKAGLTESEKQDDGTVALAINTSGDNGARLYESYVLGLEPTDKTSKPVIAPVQSAAANKVAFRLDNIAVNPRAGANSVTYKVWSGAAPGEKGVESQVASYTDPIAVDLPASGVRYYHIEVMID